MDWLSSNSLKLTQKSLDYLWQTQRFSLENIANADTPEYKAKFTTFQDELARSINAGKMQQGQNRVRKYVSDAIDHSNLYLHISENDSEREDNNNVDLDSEFLEIARTQLHYQYAVRQITQEFTRLHTAMRNN